MHAIATAVHAIATAVHAVATAVHAVATSLRTVTAALVSVPGSCCTDCGKADDAGCRAGEDDFGRSLHGSKVSIWVLITH